MDIGVVHNLAPDLQEDVHDALDAVHVEGAAVNLGLHLEVCEVILHEVADLYAGIAQNKEWEVRMRDGKWNCRGLNNKTLSHQSVDGLRIVYSA